MYIYFTFNDVIQRRGENLGEGVIEFERSVRLLEANHFHHFPFSDWVLSVSSATTKTPTSRRTWPKTRSLAHL